MAWDIDFRRRLVGGPVYYGWYVVAACFLAATTTFGVIYSFNVFVDPIVAEYSSTTGTVSLLFSLQSIVSFGLAMVFGFLVDRYGARRLLLLAAVAIGGGLALVSQAGSFLAVAALYGVVVSAGLGVGFIVAYATVPRWFHRRRGLASAVAVSGSGIGIFLGPPISNALIVAVGWQSAYLFVGLLASAGLLVAAAFVADTPEALDVGYEVEFPADEAPDVGSSTRTLRTQVADVASVVHSPGLVFLLLGFLLMYVPVYVVLVHVVSHLTDVGIGRDIAVLAASLIGAMNIAGKYVFGIATDRLGEMRSIVACSLLVSLAAMAYVIVSGVPGVFVATLMFGLGYGGSAVLISPIVARFFGELDLNTLTGLIATGFAVSGSVGPYLGGLGFDLFGSYAVPLVGSGLAGLVAALSFGVAWRADRRQTKTCARESAM